MAERTTVLIHSDTYVVQEEEEVMGLFRVGLQEMSSDAEAEVGKS